MHGLRDLLLVYAFVTAAVGGQPKPYSEGVYISKTNSCVVYFTDGREYSTCKGRASYLFSHRMRAGGKEAVTSWHSSSVKAKQFHAKMLEETARPENYRPSGQEIKAIKEQKDGTSRRMGELNILWKFEAPAERFGMRR